MDSKTNSAKQSALLEGSDNLSHIVAALGDALFRSEVHIPNAVDYSTARASGWISVCALEQYCQGRHGVVLLADKDSRILYCTTTKLRAIQQENAGKTVSPKNAEQACVLYAANEGEMISLFSETAKALLRPMKFG